MKMHLKKHLKVLINGFRLLVPFSGTRETRGSHLVSQCSGTEMFDFRRKSLKEGSYGSSPFVDLLNTQMR